MQKVRAEEEMKEIGATFVISSRKLLATHGRVCVCVISMKRNSTGAFAVLFHKLCDSNRKARLNF
jgi:hypothetical protein